MGFLLEVCASLICFLPRARSKCIVEAQGGNENKKGGKGTDTSDICGGNDNVFLSHQGLKANLNNTVNKAGERQKCGLNSAT